MLVPASSSASYYFYGRQMSQECHQNDNQAVYEEAFVVKKKNETQLVIDIYREMFQLARILNTYVWFWMIKPPVAGSVRFHSNE